MGSFQQNLPITTKTPCDVQDQKAMINNKGKGNKNGYNSTYCYILLDHNTHIS